MSIYIYAEELCEINMNFSQTTSEKEKRSKLQRYHSFPLHDSVRSSQLRHSSRQEITPSPEVDADITILNGTPREKLDRLLQEANKRDITLMATSTRATTRYAALYAASKNRGLDASLERNLTHLEMIKNKKLKAIQLDQDTIIDDFKKTKRVKLRKKAEKQHNKLHKSVSYGFEKRNVFHENGRYVKLPPIPRRKIDIPRSNHAWMDQS